MGCTKNIMDNPMIWLVNAVAFILGTESCGKNIFERCDGHPGILPMSNFLLNLCQLNVKQENIHLYNDIYTMNWRKQLICYNLQHETSFGTHHHLRFNKTNHLSTTMLQF